MVIRNTRQRDAICAAFEKSGRPLSPEEARAAAAEQIPLLGIATVYRNIRVLVQDKWLAEVALPGEPARYERAGKVHHHHFRCRVCNKVYELEGCPEDDVSQLAPAGFELEDHEITLFGRCADCVTGRRGRSRSKAGGHRHAGHRHD